MTLRCFDEPLTGPLRALAGTHRARSLAATWRRFAPVAPRVGITRIADLTGLDTLGVPVCAAIRPLGKSLSTSQGKGTTALAARVSALMESLETWHAEERAPERVTSARALGATTIALARGLPRRVRRLDVDARWPWVRGWALAAGRAVWVPWQAVSLDTVPVAVTPPVFDVSSNGLASGNTLGEAIIHGLCEVIERDAEAAWRVGGADVRVVLDTVAPPVARLVERLRQGGVRVWLWDLTTSPVEHGSDRARHRGSPPRRGSGVGVPVFGCGLMHDPREAGWRALGFYQGFGCHVDPAIAMLRAITEAVQTRLTYIAGGRDDFFPTDYQRATDPDLLAAVWARYAAPPDESVDARAHRAPRLRDVGAVLEHLLARLDAAGTPEVVVVDLRRPDLDVPVVKVLVPGRAGRVEELG